MTKPKDSNSSLSEKKSDSRVSTPRVENSEKAVDSGASLSKNKEIKKLLDMGVQRGLVSRQFMLPRIGAPSRLFMALFA